MPSILQRLFLGLCLSFAVTMATGSIAAAQSARAACESLARSNIDCACVASRVAVFERVSTSGQARAVIVQGYLSALGLDNSLNDAAEALMSDPMQAMAAIEAYDQVGGQPTSIQEYEQGCVIEGAPMAAIPQPSATPAANHYTDLCSSIASGERWCACSTARIEAQLGQPEAEAFLWGQADVRTVEPEDRARSYRARGAQMGLSAEAFEAMLQRARTRYAEFEERDALRCEAYVWADNELGTNARMRQEAGFDPGAVAQLTSGEMSRDPDLDSASGSLANAREITARSCAANGNSDHYCACYMRDFEARVVEASSPDVALAWALSFGADGGIGASERMTLVQDLPPGAMQEAGMLFSSTMDIGNACAQSGSGAREESARMAGSASERMERLCRDDGADAATCACAVERMEAAFPPADFELIVDIREADARGEDDPLAAVAAERGLSADEARDALENNPAIIRGAMVMGQSMMQCMGGMPAIPGGIPGMPGGGG